MNQNTKLPKTVKAMVWSKGRKEVAIGEMLTDVMGRSWKLTKADWLGDKLTLWVNDGKARRDKPFAIMFFRDVEVIDVVVPAKKAPQLKKGPPAKKVKPAAPVTAAQAEFAEALNEQASA